MNAIDSTQVQTDTTASDVPLTKFGLGADDTSYMEGEGSLAAPSLFNTSSKYLNNPVFRDVYVQNALSRIGPDVPLTYIIPMMAKALGEVTDYAEYTRSIEEEKKNKPEFAQWLAARQHARFRAEDLVGCQDGTLGHAIWKYLTETTYQMDRMWFGDVEVTNDIDYISQRRSWVHDVEHMITGFGTNYAGEVGIVWADIASMVNYFSIALGHHMTSGLVFLNTGALMKVSLHYRDAFPTILEAMQRGVEMGQALKRPLLIEPWEEMIDMQISDIRNRLCITRPGPGKDWDWTIDATFG